VRVGHDDPCDVTTLPDVRSLCTQLFKPLDLGCLVLGPKVNVQSVTNAVV
jgi:hypothetical protein